MIEQIEALIAANKADKNRTPFLEVALGGLQTARENLQSHAQAIDKLAAAKAEELKRKTAEVVQLAKELEGAQPASATETTAPEQTPKTPIAE